MISHDDAGELLSGFELDAKRYWWAPGEMQTVSFSLKPPDPGEYLLEFDLVSEGVGWFEMNGSTTVSVGLTVT